MHDNQQKPKINFSNLKEKLTSTKALISGTVGVVLVLLVVMIVQSCTPRKGSIIYGLCGTFLEQQITFPQTLNYTSVEQYPVAVRIYYTYTDTFGQYQFNRIECTFRQDSEKGVQLERVFFDAVNAITETERVKGKGRLYEVKREYIDLFNKSQSAVSILSQNPDLTLPQNGAFRF